MVSAGDDIVTRTGREEARPARPGPARPSKRADVQPSGPGDAPPPRRADAERNIAAILTAGLDQLSQNPAASMAQIAKAAGVGRVTLYAHFGSRADLLKALVERTLGETGPALDEALAADGPADEALARLIRSSWRILDRNRRLRVAAFAELGPDWMNAQHDRTLGPITALIARGRAEGVFRADLPDQWVLTVAYSLLHTAAEEVDAGRLTADEAPELVITTLLAALAGPGRRRRP
jgi:TetR/AcrR family transcriptional regulator, mexCD-oprJ operon repressor